MIVASAYSINHYGSDAPIQYRVAIDGFSAQTYSDLNEACWQFNRSVAFNQTLFTRYSVNPNYNDPNDHWNYTYNSNIHDNDKISGLYRDNAEDMLLLGYKETDPGVTALWGSPNKVNHIDEADIILNTDVSLTSGTNGYNVRTVLTHEVGHAAGLAHSEYNNQVMSVQPSGSIQHWLGSDDVDGIEYIKSMR